MSCMQQLNPVLLLYMLPLLLEKWCRCWSLEINNLCVCAAESRAAEENEARIFVALFPYDPATMSPNPDAAEEELPFKEGQIIKV